MAARSLGLAAALGLAANAFLLPPSVSTDDIKADLDLSTWMLVDPSSQPLVVPCKGCETDLTGPKDLLLNIATGSRPGTLELGGKAFYPPSGYMGNGDIQPDAQVVPQGVSVTDAMSQQHKYSTVPISTWSLFVDESKAPFVTEQGEELIELILSITHVEQSIVIVPDIRVTIMKDPKVDSLTILSTGLYEQAPATPETGHEDKPACEGALCQWRQFIEDKFHGISAAAHHKLGKGRPCPGKMAGMMKDGIPYGRPSTSMHHGPDSHHHRPLGEAGRPHHHHGHPQLHHGHHEHHNTLHQIMHRVGRFIMAVAIPILIGIAAGILTYTVGMVLGCAIALIWIKVFRGGKKGYASVAQAEPEAAAKDLEAVAEPRASYESAPPTYEDAPAYEEKQVV